MTQVYPAKEELIEMDDAFRRLHEEHQACERRLDNMHQQNLLSEDDEVEIKRLKIQKLQLKDRMETIRRQHQLAPSVV